MSKRVALATCGQFPALTEGDPLLLAALRARGIDAEAAVWDDGEVEWEKFDLVVIRSTWDYAPRREKFMAWARRIPRLLNSADVVAWNTDKHYLSELPHAVRTQYLEPGAKFVAPDGEYVIKPAISAGSRDTARYGPGEERAAERHVHGLLEAGRSTMVQPYLAEVDTHGETALVYFRGTYSHAIRKGQLLRPGADPATGLFVQEDIAPRQPEADERAVAEDVLDALRWPRTELLYARVDLIRDRERAPRIVELELTEPSLFLDYADDAASRLADEIVKSA